MAAKTLNREAWLNALAKALRGWFKAEGLEIPEVVKLSCGFPSRNALRTSSKAIGECWSYLSSEGAHPEIFVSPLVADTMEVAQIVVHELLHAVLGVEVGHGPLFASNAKRLLLEGAPTATVHGEAFQAKLQPILDKLGDYPHSKINAAEGGRKKQTTRLVKVECEDCGYTARVTRKWLDEPGPPLCPCNHEPMTEADE